MNQLNKSYALFFMLFIATDYGWGQNETMKDVDTVRMKTAAMASQSTADKLYPELIPPSPNAASLGMYGDIPVGHYSGVPNINTPLYEITRVFSEFSIKLVFNYIAGS